MTIYQKNLIYPTPSLTLPFPTNKNRSIQLTCLLLRQRVQIVVNKSDHFLHWSDVFIERIKIVSHSLLEYTQEALKMYVFIFLTCNPYKGSLTLQVLIENLIILVLFCVSSLSPLPFLCSFFQLLSSLIPLQANISYFSILCSQMFSYIPLYLSHCEQFEIPRTQLPRPAESPMQAFRLHTIQEHHI